MKEKRTLKHIKLVKKSTFTRQKKYYEDEYSDDGYDSYNDINNEPDEIMREIKKKYRMPKNVWIIKPGENTNRGNGIEVASTICEVK